MVLPIDASSPLPPPSGSVCRPSASSMIASKASPAKPKRSISKRYQSVHHMLHIEQNHQGSNCAYDQLAQAAALHAMYKEAHEDQMVSSFRHSFGRPNSCIDIPEPFSEKCPFAHTHDMQVCKIGTGDRQYLQGEWAFLQQADIGRAPWKGPQQRPATGLGSDGRRCPHLQLAARSSWL